ncbi:unnamed protein product [Urochloa decumbens]|uniref:Uncharacterized protein n=1 Tax=Urochloa decumbens TaxID=240449 RepID=A0ABC9DRU8_9POAL
MVAGTRPVVSPAQVELFMSEHFELGRDDVEVRLHRPDDFLLVFRRRIDADRVLHAEPPGNSVLRLTFRRWRREACAVSEPLQFKVLLDMKGIPGHLWEVDVAQRIVGTSCSIIQAAPDVETRRNMRTFTVAAWAVHPDLIPEEVVVIVPEKDAPFSPGNLFLRPEELIHTSKSTLRYRVSIEVREVQDWHETPDSSSDERREHGRSDDDESDQDGFPGAGNGGRSSKPWPRRHRFSPGNGPGGSTWPTAKGCDSVLGWWGHANGPCNYGHAWSADKTRKAAVPPQRWSQRGRPTRRETSASVGTTTAAGRPLRSVEDRDAPAEEDFLPSRHDTRVDPLMRWDPMRQESLKCMQTSGEIPVVSVFGRILSAVGARRSLGPSLETVTFPVTMPVVLEGADAASARAITVEQVKLVPGMSVHGPCSPVHRPGLPGTLVGGHAVSPTVLQAVVDSCDEGNANGAWSPQATRFVTTSRGSPPAQHDNVPLSDADFADLCTKPLPETVVITSPPRRKPRRTYQDSLLPRRSSRIAKKTKGRVSNPVVAAQNVLMRKLGILQPDAEPDAEAVQQYTDLMGTGLSESDAVAIDTIFPDHVPDDGELAGDDETVEV